MLSLGPGSACDVCLEPFDHGLHAPHSIRCGHVFCLGCLHHLTPVVCPLCRQPFEPLSFVKLHIDLDNIRPVSSNVPLTTTPTPDQEARRLQEAIADVANQGASEQHLRQLIDQCRAFLAGQPRSAFQDLRVSHRMLAYMCDIRSKLKAEKQVAENLHTQVVDLAAEKKELEKRNEVLQATIRDEKETALAVEMSLREHCNRAQAAYQYMADRYKYVVSEWAKLNEELTLLRSGALPLDDSYQPRPVNVSDLAICDFPSLPSLDGPSDSDLKAKVATASQPESYLISPLPEFTSVLPSSLDGFTALPEVDDDLEKKSDGNLSMSSVPSSSCGAKGCPFSCHCVSFPAYPRILHSMSLEFGPEPAPPSSESVSLSAPDSSTENLNKALPMSCSLQDSHHQVPGDLSLTMPKSHSILSRSTSRSHSFSSHRSRPSSRSRSRPASRSRSPSPKSAQEGYTIITSDTGGRETEHLRSRLHDILHDTSVSCSLPNMSSTHFSLSARIDMKQPPEISRPPSRSASTSSHRPLPSRPIVQPVASQPLNSRPSLNLNPSVPSTSTAHNSATATVQRPTVMSHASSAAMALEKAQRAERERQKAEKERQKEEHRDNKDRDRLEQRPRSDSNRSRIQASSFSTATSSQSSGSHREESTNGYHVSTSSGSSLRRDSSLHIRVTPSSLRDSTFTYVSSQQHRYPPSSKGKLSTNMTSETRVAGLYA